MRAGAWAVKVVVDASELAGEKGPETEEKGEEVEAELEEGEGAGEGTEAEEKTLVDELASFLSERLGREVEVSGGEIRLEVEGPAGRRRIKQLVKKFLHKWELEDDFRVISLGEGVFKVKKRRFPRLKKQMWA